MFIKKNLFALFSSFIKTEAYSYRHLKNNLTKVDHKIILVCIVTMLVLTCTYYFGDVRFLISLLEDLGFADLSQQLREIMTIHPDAALYRPLYWASVLIFFYCVLPAICIKFFFKQRFSDYGLGFKGAFKYYRLYIGMLIVMVPLVIYFSASESFLKTYPFYKVAPGDNLFPNFFIWEIFYFLQFVALEFFFRGFILHGTKHRFGFYAIFFMTVPYCMIHFGKPMAETIAAIIAGVILGYMSLKSRNIWMGVFVHCSVAFMMDISALMRRGVFSSEIETL